MVFVNAANKTDYLLKRLVESLEKKLDQDTKGYQVEQARIRQKIRKNQNQK